MEDRRLWIEDFGWEEEVENLKRGRASVVSVLRLEFNAWELVLKASSWSAGVYTKNKREYAPRAGERQNRPFPHLGDGDRDAGMLGCRPWSGLL